MYDKLIKIVEKRKEVELAIAKQKQQFEDTIAVELAMLEDLKNTEANLREEAILAMDKSGDLKIEEGNKLITKCVKETNRINDPFVLYTSIKDNEELLKAGIDMAKIGNSFEPTVEITDKKFITKVIKDYESLKGELPNGVEKKSTKYITISDNKNGSK